MSVIIRLQNLPWSANALDIREFFKGLQIPEGGVHIVGGELGDAFIAFGYVLRPLDPWLAYIVGVYWLNTYHQIIIVVYSTARHACNHKNINSSSSLTDMFAL